MDFAAAAQVISERRCVDTKAPADTTLARRLREFLAHRFPNTDTADPRCPVRLLVGRDAEEFRRRQAPGVPEPVVGTVSAFVKREPGGQGLIIGIEGDADHWPDLLVPEAPLTFLRVRSGQIVAAWGAGLPRIEVPLPHDAPSDSARD